MIEFVDIIKSDDISQIYNQIIDLTKEINDLVIEVISLKHEINKYYYEQRIRNRNFNSL